MEGHYVVTRLFSRSPVEFWDIGRQFGQGLEAKTGHALWDHWSNVTDQADLM
jgi:hypothetical protein